MVVGGQQLGHQSSVDDVHRILSLIPRDVTIEATIIRDHQSLQVELS